ncbi:MAG: DUF6600 domain-containing protein [Candidatus Krumholzibacteriia bacterium]
MNQRTALSIGLRGIAACVLASCWIAGCTYVEPGQPGEYYEAPEPEPPASYTEGEFGELTDYGRWIHTAPFGWVWQPYSEEDWQPFYDGHWVWSQWGWTWVSYEPYGWAVYHYGNWVFDPIWAWIWIPAYEWYPTRVQWIVYDDYICWAPMPPPGYLIGDPWASPIDDLWIIVEPGYFTHSHVGRYTKRRYRWKTTSSSITQVIRNAPNVGYLTRRTGKTVPRVDIEIRKYKIGSKEIKKMKLPPEHRKKLERYKARTRKRIEKREGESPRTKAGKPARKDGRSGAGIKTKPESSRDGKTKKKGKVEKPKPRTKQKKGKTEKPKSGKKTKKKKRP